MFDKLAKLRPQIEYRFWAGPGHEGQTLNQLIAALMRAGNKIVEIDETHKRVLVSRWTETQDRWGCRFCLTEGAVVICDSEQELLTHCDSEHPDWRNA